MSAKARARQVGRKRDARALTAATRTEVMAAVFASATIHGIGVLRRDEDGTYVCVDITNLELVERKPASRMPKIKPLHMVERPRWSWHLFGRVR